MHFPESRGCAVLTGDTTVNTLLFRLILQRFWWPGQTPAWNAGLVQFRADPMAVQHIFNAFHLRGLGHLLGYSWLSLCSLHKHLSWETAHRIHTATSMATLIIWQWSLLLYFPCISYARFCFQLLYSIAAVFHHLGRYPLESFCWNVSAISENERCSHRDQQDIRAHSGIVAIVRQ